MPKIMQINHQSSYSYFTDPGAPGTRAKPKLVRSFKSAMKNCPTDESTYKNECSLSCPDLDPCDPSRSPVRVVFKSLRRTMVTFISLHFHFDPSLGSRDSKGFSEDGSHMNIQMHTFFFGE